MTMHRGHSIALDESSLDGCAAWRYQIADELGRLCGIGWYAGAREQAERHARHAIDNRLAERAAEKVN